VIPANPLRGIPGKPPTSELRAGLCKSQQTTIWTSQRPWQDFTHDNENGFATTVFTYGITLKHKGIETLWQAIMGRIDATAMVVVAMSAAKRTSSKRANSAPKRRGLTPPVLLTAVPSAEREQAGPGRVELGVESELAGLTRAQERAGSGSGSSGLSAAHGWSSSDLEAGGRSAAGGHPQHAGQGRVGAAPEARGNQVDDDEFTIGLGDFSSPLSGRKLVKRSSSSSSIRAVLGGLPFPSRAMRRNAASSRSLQSITSMSRTFNRPAQQASRSPPVGAVRGQDQPETATRQ
jgi:hypothetical protein